MGFVLRAGIGALGAATAIACTAITGADGLSTDPASSSGDIVAPPKETTSGEGDEDRARGGSTSSSSSSGEPTPSSDGGDAATEAAPITPPNAPVFEDAFGRADGQIIGNGWAEKRPDLFVLLGGAVKQTAIGDYKNMIVARVEPVLDITVSMEASFESFDADPTLMARLQPQSTTLGQLYGYTFYSYVDWAYIDREEGSGPPTMMASKEINPKLDIGGKYRLTFKVTGTDPVKLEASVTKLDGTPIISFGATDASAKKITNPGGYAFGSGDGKDSVFDNFKRY